MAKDLRPWVIRIFVQIHVSVKYQSIKNKTACFLTEIFTYEFAKVSYLLYRWPGMGIYFFTHQ